MGRFVVIRDADEPGERSVEESAVPSEAALHEVLMRHPELVPATDLGFGRVATVGFEVSLASGFADLVLLDDAGRVCIVEVKKEGNPDTRRVIAQLLDYAASLWGLTVNDFERGVLRRKLGEDDLRGLQEFIIDELVADADEPEDAAEEVMEGLADTLRTGDFTLVLAAPEIPDGVQRVIEYLNARGHSIFGLEVSYFAGEVEAFVPRIVVRPSLSGRIAGQDAQPSKEPIDADAFYAALPEAVRDQARAFVEGIESAGGELQWRSYGPRVRVRGEAGPKVMASLDSKWLYFTIAPRQGMDPEFGKRAAERLGSLPSWSVTTEYAGVKWADMSSDQAEASLARVGELVDELSRAGSANDAREIGNGVATQRPATAADSEIR